MVTRHLRVAYFVAANTAILLVLMQAGAALAIRFSEPDPPGLSASELNERELQNYAHMSPPDRDELLRATGAIRYRYEPVVGYLHEAVSSPFINIDGGGIRSNGGPRPASTPLDGAVWVFGGSTAFGYGVADGETIPAQFERLLGRPVANLGVSSYASDEENLLLNYYLKAGYRPSAALFLDGVNEACETYEYEREMRILFDRAQRGYVWDLGGPIADAYARFTDGLDIARRGGAHAPTIDGFTCRRAGARPQLRTLHARTLAERAALCGLYGVECVTFVQPFAGLHGRRDGFRQGVRDGYHASLRKLFAHLESNWRDAGALFLTDVLDGYDRHPFVDDVHYSADVSRLLAGAMAERVLGAGRPLAP